MDEHQEHEADQDRRIEANATAIEELTGYIRELRDHFEPISAFVEKVPVRWKASMRILRAVVGFGAVAAVILKGGVWYYNRQQLESMAERYVQVAKDLYYSENNPDVALPFVEKAIAIDDENPEYLYFRDYIRCMSATRRMLNLDRPFTKAELDEAHRAYADARLLEQIAPERPEPHILKGQILAALKETVRAREAVMRAVELDPESDFAWMRLAMVQLDEKDVEGAKRSLARAESINPNAKWTWLWKGIVAGDFEKNVEVARTCYEKALALDPKFDMALYNLGWTFMRRPGQNYVRARECFQRALRVNPDYKEACYAIGMAYGYEDNYPVAKVWMEKAVALDPGFLTGQKWSGIVSGEMKDYRAAIDCFGKAIHLDPMNADLFVRRAKMETAISAFEDARRDLEFALELDGKSKRTYLYLGDLLLKLGKAEAALAKYGQAVALDAEYGDAHAGRARALLSLGRAKDALDAVETAIKVTKYKPERYESLRAEVLKKAK